MVYTPGMVARCLPCLPAHACGFAPPSAPGLSLADREGHSEHWPWWVLLWYWR